jgi:alcohol dehydrogenase class IV
VYDAVEPDPRIEIVERALEAYTAGKCDLLVAVGGGSAMDTAKATAILANNPGRLRSYEGWEKFERAPAPLFALPTSSSRLAHHRRRRASPSSTPYWSWVSRETSRRRRGWTP